MSDHVADRLKEAETLAADQLWNISEAGKVFISSLKGFRRDLLLSTQACPDHIRTQFAEQAIGLDMPLLQSGEDFASLSQMLALAETALDGKVIFHDSLIEMKQSDRDSVLEEIDITHRNLVDVSDTARRLYESVQASSLEFDMFNRLNIDGGIPEANVRFDRDALNVSMETARALGELAVRLDIDLMESREKLAGKGK